MRRFSEPGRASRLWQSARSAGRVAELGSVGLAL